MELKVKLCSGLNHNLMAEKRVEIKFLNSDCNTYLNCGTVEHGPPQGSVFGPLLFLLYINDLPPNINSQSKPILFAEDTIIIII
jgi:hypothetical protein